MEPFHSHRGFTLIEMLVVLAIITILAAIVLTSQSAFNRTLVLDSTAYDIGLTVRSAETYGISTRAVSISNVGYGVDFDISTPYAFTLFGDTYPPAGSGNYCHPVPANGTDAPDAKAGDCIYEASGPNHDVVVSSFAVGNGIKVTSVEALVTNGVSAPTWQSFSKLDIVFSRPNAEPFISAYTGGVWTCSANNNNVIQATGSCGSSGTVEKACIVLASPSGGTRAIEVNTAGEITANSATCLP